MLLPCSVGTPLASGHNPGEAAARRRDAASVDAALTAPNTWGYLIAGHGLYAWGKDISEARRHLDAFEFMLGCELEMRRLRG